jgi:hypothetical protein
MIAGLIALMVGLGGASSAFALTLATTGVASVEQSFTGTDDYGSVPFNVKDDALGAAAVVSGALLLNMTHPMVLEAAAITAFYVWGARRTAKYRSPDTQAMIRTNIAAREGKPVPGSFAAGVQCNSSC